VVSVPKGSSVADSVESADIFEGYEVRDLDDIRTAVQAVLRAIDLGTQDEHAGAGTMQDAVGRIHGQLVDSLGEERAVRAIAAVVYGLTLDSATTLVSWNNAAANRMVDLLKEQERL
jgi:hypothetical protein